MLFEDKYVWKKLYRNIIVQKKILEYEFKEVTYLKFVFNGCDN